MTPDRRSLLYVSEADGLSAELIRVLRGRFDGVRVLEPGDPASLRQVNAVVTTVRPAGPERLSLLDGRARRERASLLPLCLLPGTAVIGPELGSGGGCWECWLRRYARSQGTDAETVRSLAFDGQPSSDPRPSPYTRLAHPGVRTATETAAAMAAGVDAFHRSRTEDDVPWVFHLDLQRLTGSPHRVLPDPLCPACSSRPEDTPEGANTPPGRENGRSDRVQAFRTRPLKELSGGLVAEYVDGETGVIARVTSHLECPGSAVSSARLPTERETGPEEAFGCARDYRSARTISILEAMERYAGIRPRGRKTAVRSDYRAVRDDAVDPASLGLHAEEAYRGDSELVPYREDLEFRWVWSYSFGRDGPVLLPEQIAYYGAHQFTSDPRFVYEVSNGCAIGCRPDEALFHGLLEVLERDAFLVAWYGRITPPRIDRSRIRSGGLEARLSMLEDAGYEVILSDITTGVGVPCVWVTLLNREKEVPYMIGASGAHPDPEGAIESAVDELIGMVPHRERLDGDDEARARVLLRDSHEVETMRDHSLLYSLPEASDRLAFLVEGGETVGIEEMESRSPGLHGGDLEAGLGALVERLLERGLDVLAVDQTPPDQERCGLSTVKALVPGLLPITFGYDRRRLRGLDRVEAAMASGGEGASPAGVGSVNPHPHPFP